MIVGWNKPLKVLQVIVYVYFIGKDPLLNIVREKSPPVFLHFDITVNSSSNHQLLLGLEKTISRWVRSAVTGDTIKRWEKAAGVRGYYHRVCMVSRYWGCYHRSITRYGQLKPKDTIKKWVWLVVFDDTIDMWVLSARAVENYMYYQVSIVSLDWGIQSPGRYG